MDAAAAIPEITWDDKEGPIDPPPPEAALPVSHSLDLTLLIPTPRRDALEPNTASSLVDKFNVLILPQSLENTSNTLCRIPLSIAITSHSAKESFVIEIIPPSFLPPPKNERLKPNDDPGVDDDNPTSNPPPPSVVIVFDGEFN